MHTFFMIDYDIQQQKGSVFTKKCFIKYMLNIVFLLFTFIPFVLHIFSKDEDDQYESE